MFGTPLQDFQSGSRPPRTSSASRFTGTPRPGANTRATGPGTPSAAAARRSRTPASCSASSATTPATMTDAVDNGTGLPPADGIPDGYPNHPNPVATNPYRLRGVTTATDWIPALRRDLPRRHGAEQQHPGQPGRRHHDPADGPLRLRRLQRHDDAHPARRRLKTSQLPHLPRPAQLLEGQPDQRRHRPAARDAAGEPRRHREQGDDRREQLHGGLPQRPGQLHDRRPRQVRGSATAPPGAPPATPPASSTATPPTRSASPSTRTPTASNLTYDGIGDGLDNNYNGEENELAEADVALLGGVDLPGLPPQLRGARRQHRPGAPPPSTGLAGCLDCHEPHGTGIGSGPPTSRWSGDTFGETTIFVTRAQRRRRTSTAPTATASATTSTATAAPREHSTPRRSWATSRSTATRTSPTATTAPPATPTRAAKLHARLRRLPRLPADRPTPSPTTPTASASTPCTSGRTSTAAPSATTATAAPTTTTTRPAGPQGGVVPASWWTWSSTRTGGPSTRTPPTPTTVGGQLTAAPTPAPTSPATTPTAAPPGNPGITGKRPAPHEQPPAVARPPPPVFPINQCTGCHVVSPSDQPRRRQPLHCTTTSPPRAQGLRLHDLPRRRRHHRRRHRTRASHAQLTLDTTGIVHFNGTIGGQDLSTGTYETPTANTCYSVYCHGGTLAAPQGSNTTAGLGVDRQRRLRRLPRQQPDRHHADDVHRQRQPHHARRRPRRPAPYGPQAACTDCHTYTTGAATHIDGYVNFTNTGIATGTIRTDVTVTSCNSLPRRRRSTGEGPVALPRHWLANSGDVPRRASATASTATTARRRS